MNASRRHCGWLIGWAALMVAVRPATAEKRLSLGIGGGLYQGPVTTDGAAGDDDGAELTSRPSIGLGIAYEWDHSLRWAWQAGVDAGHAFGDDALSYAAADLGGAYRLDILAWVPYVRGAVGVKAVLGAANTSIAPTATAALGLMRLRDRDSSWRGEVRYRISVDVGGDANAPAHDVGLWLSRTWHWDYF